MNNLFRYIKMWDTETGQVCGRFSNKKMAFCAKFNPNDALQHLIVAGTSSNKIVCWDTRLVLKTSGKDLLMEIFQVWGYCSRI